MAYLEREITIISPESNGHFGQWPINYDEYDSDPLERVDRARADRGDYYRRVESTSRNSNVFDPSERRAISPGGRTLLDLMEGDGEMVVKEKRISDGGPSADSVPRIPEPHTSWRFYTSYDNGEWRRHAVPVHHSEEEVLSSSPSRTGRTRTESSSGDLSGLFSGVLSPTFGLETSVRRMRINRPSVYEALQSRRRRTIEGARRVRTPRSPEVILNMSEYLPPEEIRRRYEVKDYVPKRKTEYGERVIYPRLKSGSMSDMDTEPIRSFSSQVQKPKLDANFEEVTRTMHQSDMSRSGISSNTVDAIPANQKPVNDYGYQEKVIIPTKYKTERERKKEAALPDNKRVVDESMSSKFSTLEQQQQQQRQSRNRSDYVQDRPSAETRREIKNYERIIEPSVRQSPRLEQNYTNQFSRSINDEEFDDRMGRGDAMRSYEPRDSGRLVVERPRDKSRSQEREVKVVVVKNQQDRPEAFAPRMKPEDDQRAEIVKYKSEDRREGERQQGKSSRADELASQVRSSTLDTMKQMENQMLQHMKAKCPEASEIMDSLVSGTEGKDMTMEKKEAFAEQVSLWQGGKPIEEKLNRETRYRSNDPISGPQDFVERSSISRGRNEMQDMPFFNPYTSVKTDTRARNQGQSRDARYESGRGDRYRDPRDSYYSGDDRTSSVFYPSENSSPVRQDSTRAEHYGFSGHRRADYSHQQQVQREDFGKERIARDERPRAPEERNETVEKIIIPTKYRQNRVDRSSGPKMSDPRSDVSMRSDASVRSDGKVRSAVSERSTVGEMFETNRGRNYPRESDYVRGGEGGGLSEFAAFVSKEMAPSAYDEFVDHSGGPKTSDPRSDTSMRSDASVRSDSTVRSAVSERSTVGEMFGTNRGRNYPRESDYVRGGEGGGVSEFAAFISKEMAPSAYDEFDALDGRLGYVRPESTRASKSRVTSQGEVPMEIRRMGSLHDEGPSGEWEFDMAVREIPRR